jgi:hypothetical protein
MNHEKFRAAFLQGEEKEAAKLFRQLLRQSIRIGLLEAMQEEVEALCGPRYRSDTQSPCHRAGSESGVVCMDGGRVQIQRPRVHHNASAALALESRRDALLSFHRLDVPATLNVTFLSTNLIENVLRNWRGATGNVKHWNEKEDMIPRWMASGLLWAEGGFRRIRHAEDLPRLADALALSTPSGAPACAVAPSSAASTRAGRLAPCAPVKA